MTYQSLNPLPHHDETTALVTASPEDVFAFIDDHERLLSHMSQPSWQMGGGRIGSAVFSGLLRTLVHAKHGRRRCTAIYLKRETNRGSSGMTDSHHPHDGKILKTFVELTEKQLERRLKPPPERINTTTTIAVPIREEMKQ